MVKITKLFKNKQIKNEQITFCYCPICKNELTSSNSFIKEDIYVYYKCSKCKKETKWDFDVPVPIIIND